MLVARNHPRMFGDRAWGTRRSGSCEIIDEDWRWSLIGTRCLCSLTSSSSTNMDGIVRQSAVKHEAAMIMDVRNHPWRCPCPLDWAENKEVGRCARLILHPFFNTALFVEQTWKITRWLGHAIKSSADTCTPLFGDWPWSRRWPSRPYEIIHEYGWHFPLIGREHRGLSVCMLVNHLSIHPSIHEHGWYWPRTPRSVCPLASESLTIHPSHGWMGTVPFSGAYSTRRPKSSSTMVALSVDWEWALRTEAGRILRCDRNHHRRKGRCPLIGSENRGRRLCAQVRGPE